MAKKVGITGVGYPDFAQAVYKYERKMINEVKRIVRETAEMIVTQAKALAPVANIDGGNLRRSIDVKYHKGGLTAIITVSASYSLYVEFGTGIYAEDGKGRKTPWVYFDEKLNRWVFTRGMHPQPFFRPSVEIGARYFEKEMNRLG